MKCPRQTVQKAIDATHAEINFFDCIGEMCGQWDKDQKCCSEVSKARAEWALVKRLEEIGQKMPCWEQFRELRK